MGWPAICSVAHSLKFTSVMPQSSTHISDPSHQPLIHTGIGPCKSMHAYHMILVSKITIKTCNSEAHAPFINHASSLLIPSPLGSLSVQAHPILDYSAHYAARFQGTATAAFQLAPHAAEQIYNANLGSAAADSVAKRSRLPGTPARQQTPGRLHPCGPAGLHGASVSAMPCRQHPDLKSITESPHHRAQDAHDLPGAGSRPAAASKTTRLQLTGSSNGAKATETSARRLDSA